MRNLKRALSLGLTAAMISGLMVMGSSAASYADVTSEDNVEAIDVLQTVKIMVGDENGNFNPDQNVTRNEMAVIMANLMEYNVASYKDTSPFTDVPSWAEPYVAACYTNGITSGYSDTIYGGSDTVTTAQAALMLMKALGYFQYASDFGSDWQLATTRQANAIDLFVGVDTAVTAPMTRDDVAQLVLNTLEAGTVQPETEGSWTIGDVTITNNVKYNYVTSNQAYASAIDDSRRTNNDGDLVSGYIVELGEQLYMGDLQLRDNTSDDFERPSRTWSYNGTEIGTYVKDELIVATYTTGVTGRELYDQLTASTVREYTMDVYLDGGAGQFTKDNVTRSNNNDLAGTGNGVLTEVFLDLDTKEITVTSINTWLAKANSDYNTNSETLSLKVYDERTDGGTGYTQVIDPEDVAGIEDIVKDQYVLVNMSLKDRSKYEIVAVSDPEILTNVDVTKFATKKDGDKVNKEESLFDSLTAGGTAYDSAEKALYDEDVLNLYDQQLLTDNTYNVFLDPYGYAIGVELYEGAKNYVFITGYDMNNSNIAVRTADAAAIFMDGTMDVIEVNVTNTNKNIDADGNDKYDDYDKYDAWTSVGGNGGEYDHNLWYTYTENNGVYTLRPVGDENMLVTTYAPAEYTKTINCSNVWVQDNTAPATNIRGYGNDDSVYITAEPGDVNPYDVKTAITEVTGLYTGVQNVDIIMESGFKGAVPADIYTVIDDDQYIVASVVLGEAQGSTANYAYIIDPVISEEKLDDGTYQWEFKAVMGGTVQTLIARSDYQDVISVLKNNKDKVVELRFNGDYVVSAKAVPVDVDSFEEAIDDQTDEVFDVDTDQYLNDMVTLYLTGRTLHTGDRSTGLTFVADAPAVLHQKVRGEWKNIEYSSVQEAYDNLADASAAAGLQFEGRIVAVLNNQGVAEWVYIHTETPAENDPTTGGSGGVVVGDFPVIRYDGTKYEIRYYNVPDNQLDDYIVDVIEEYTGYAVRQYNPLTNQVWVEGFWQPLTIDPIEVFAVTADNKVQYFDETETNITGLTANKKYMKPGDTAVVNGGSAVYTADISGKVTLAAPGLSKDITLADAYNVTVDTATDSNTKLSVGTTVSAETNIYVAPSTRVTLTYTPAASAFVQFVDGAGEAVTSPVYMEAGSAKAVDVVVTDDITGIQAQAGYMLVVDGVEKGLYQIGDGDYTITSSVANAKFIDVDGDEITATAVFGGYKIAGVDMSTLATASTNGRIVINRAATVEYSGAGSLSVEFKDSEGNTVTALTTAEIVKLGTTIEITYTAPNGKHLQATVNGVTTDLGTVGDGTNSQDITYKVDTSAGKVVFSFG